MKGILDSETTTIRTQCPECKEIHDVKVSTNGYLNYKTGMLIQRALPELIPEEREMLITGFCQSCWDKIFADDEDE